MQQLNDLNIGRASLKEEFQSDISQSKFSLSIVAAFAKLEVSMCRDRVKGGLASAKKRGAKLGRRKNMTTAMKMYENGDYLLSEICHLKDHVPKQLVDRGVCLARALKQINASDRPLLCSSTGQR